GKAMSKQSDQRRETMKARCLEIISTHPGIEAANLPKNYRPLLRALEAEGKIAYRTGQGWFAEMPRATASSWWSGVSPQMMPGLWPSLSDNSSAPSSRNTGGLFFTHYHVSPIGDDDDQREQKLDGLTRCTFCARVCPVQAWCDLWQQSAGHCVCR